METCSFDAVTLLHIVEEITYAVLGAAFAFVLAATAIAATFVYIWLRWWHSILEAPVEEVSNDRGSLVTSKDCLISRESFFTPVQQNSNDKGDLIISI